MPQVESQNGRYMKVHINITEHVFMVLQMKKNNHLSLNQEHILTVTVWTLLGLYGRQF